MEHKIREMNDHSTSHETRTQRQVNYKIVCNKDAFPGCDFWTDGLICAFEYVRGRKKSVESSSAFKIPSKQVNIDFTRVKNGLQEDHNEENLLEISSTNENMDHSGQVHTVKEVETNNWKPIGWDRISELVQKIQVNGGWSSQQSEFVNDKDDLPVADLAAPYWESPAGPTWWCHVSAEHPFIQTWLSTAQWLHPAISLALRDESRLISDRMKHLLYEVPVRVAGGLLFELLGQSAGDPFANEDDIPIVLRSWQAQNFLITAMHVKGSVSSVNVLGITEVQELLLAECHNSPRRVDEVIALLASRLTQWDDRLFRKSIFGVADEVELKFMDRRNHEDLNLFGIIMNQEIKKLSRQVIRVKWSLHAREEIAFELLQHLQGKVARSLLEAIRKNTREMMEEQEAVRGRLFTIQDVMQSTVRAWLQDKSLRITHNLAIFGGCGLILTIITGLFGINVDGIPGASNTPYAFALFSGLVIFLGIVLIVMGLIYLGLKKPITGEVEVRKLELQELVKLFQHEAETHAQLEAEAKHDVVRSYIRRSFRTGTKIFDELTFLIVLG